MDAEINRHDVRFLTLEHRQADSMEFLQKVIDAVQHDMNIKEAWFYFNNDFDAVGVKNAKEMISLDLAGGNKKRRK